MLQGRLSTQVGVLFFLAMTMVVSLMSWREYAQVSNALPKQAEYESLQYAETVAESVASNVLYKKSYPLWTQMKKMVDRFKKDHLLHIDSYAVIDEQNLLLAHADMVNHPLMTTMMLRKPGQYWQGHTLSVITPVFHPTSSRKLGLIEIQFDVSSIQQRLTQTKQEYMIVLLLVFLVSAVLAIGIRQRVAKPLKSLITLSSEVGTGSVSAAEFENKPKEIREMAESMAKADRSIVASNNEVKQLVAVVEQADELVIITDLKGIIQYVNPAFENITGYSVDEARGETPRIVKSGDHDGSYYKAMWEALAAGKVWKDDFINRRKDGSLYEVTQNIFPIYDAEGEASGFAAVQRDVTQFRKVEEKLHHTDRVESLGVLAGGIAHDFNNLLTAMLGNAALALKKLDHTSPAYGHLESIEAASHSAADLCRQMLAYSGKGRFVVKAVNLSVLLDGMSKLIEVSIPNNIVLKYKMDDEVPHINADIAQMQQVILNLITNAAEAIGDRSGVITLATGMMDAGKEYLFGSVGTENLPAGRYVFLEVSDTGCGMTSEVQKKIFDPFFTTKFTGRGLGMSAMLGIVQGHKGVMRIYSEVGQGTSIRVLFPEDKETNHSDEVEQPKMKVHAKGSVLIIDDEPTVREVVSNMLQDLGFPVLCAEDGYQGLELYRLHQSDISLVILDMTMPKMDGSECFRQLRQMNPAVQVVLSSGYNEQEATSRFVGKGLAGFIQKPYSPDALTEKIAAIFPEVEIV